MDGIASFFDPSFDPAIRGSLHTPQKPNGDALVLTHGAGSNCAAPLLVALAETFCEHGYTVLRCDLPYRQQRPTGPPFPGQAERDRSGLRNAVAAIRKQVTGKVFLGGHSYGGRQSTILCSAEPELAAGLLLLSYPLHPPRKPDQLRVEHLPNLRTPSLFVSGTRDPFGSPEELERALLLIPAKHHLIKVEGAGHDLGFKRTNRLADLPATILEAWQGFMG
jgi:uncharacterized protein